MKRRVCQSVFGIITGMVLLTACGNKSGEAVSGKFVQPEVSAQEETVLVYRVCEEILFSNNNNNGNTDYGEDALNEALRFEYKYDADGNKARQIGYDSYGNGDTREYEYTFDADGSRVKETYCGKSGGAKKCIDYRYDADGELTERAFWIGNDYMVTRFYGADGECPAIAQMRHQIRAALGSSDVMRYISYDNGMMTEFATAQYDAEGNRVREAIYSADGSPMYSYDYDYDAAGNITRETVYDADGALLNTGRFEYRYDEYGNILEQKRFLDGNFIGMTKYNYTQVSVPKRSSKPGL